MVDSRIATTAIGTERVVKQEAAEKFRSSLRGGLLRPSDDGYDEARKIWNAMIDRRPGLIARCTGAADVLASVRFGPRARPARLGEGWRSQRRGHRPLRRGPCHRPLPHEGGPR